MFSKNRNYSKFLLLIPALLGCSMLATNAMPSEGGTTEDSAWTYNGNSFTFRYTDTLIYDHDKKKVYRALEGSDARKQLVATMNGETVYQNDYLEAPASYGKNASSYIDYVKDQFALLRKNTPDSMAIVTELDLVVDKTGKVVYYNAKYERIVPANAAYAQTLPLYSFVNPQITLDGFMKKIIESGPVWIPATVNGKPVNSFVNVQIPGC